MKWGTFVIPLCLLQREARAAESSSSGLDFARFHCSSHGLGDVRAGRGGQWTMLRRLRRCQAKQNWFLWFPLRRDRDSHKSQWRHKFLAEGTVHGWHLEGQMKDN